MQKLLAAGLTVTLTVGALTSAAAAHPASEPKCADETYAVVAAPGDAAMAELVASWQVLNTKCVVEPDDTDMIDRQQVVVLGGTNAVPNSAVDGLTVIVRLAGPDRVATARAVLDWTGQRQNGNLAATATVQATSSSGESKATFTVGKDIQAGFWRFTESTGRFGDFMPAPNTHSAFGYRGRGCRVPAEGTAGYIGGLVTVNETGDGFGPSWRKLGQGADAIATTVPFKTYVFELVDGDKVTLRTLPGEVCEIERHT